MEWSKLVPVITIISLAVGLMLNITFGVWYTSELFYRVSVAETKLLQIESRQVEDQKIMENAIVAEVKISGQIDALKDLLDRMLRREEANARDGVIPPSPTAH